MRLLSEEYQGWSNRETWSVALHLSNDQGLYLEVQGLTREAIDAINYKAIDSNTLKEAGYRLADTLEELVNGLLEFDNVSTNEQIFIMLTDIGSLYRVNWREIAQTYIDTMVSDMREIAQTYIDTMVSDSATACKV
jgi:DNA/RNA-binding domain of Phe-tRNA-synthetase-like protein